MIPQPNTHKEVAKNQHFVPQTYMRMWSYNGTDSVYVYDKEANMSHDLHDPDAAESWKLEQRNVEKINCLNNFYDFKAGDIWMPPEALNEIFGVLSGYQITLGDKSLTSLEDLNQKYFDFDNWDILRPDGNLVTKKERNEIRNYLQLSRYAFSEPEWSIQYENRWNGFITGLENRIRIIKGLIPGNESLKQTDVEDIFKCLVMFDWRTNTGNGLVAHIVDWFFDIMHEWKGVQIPRNERVHNEDEDIQQELKHALMRKTCFDFLNGKGNMNAYFNQYLTNLSLVFYLTDEEHPFITSDNPSEMITLKNGCKEHVFVATPTMLIGTCRTEDTKQFLILPLSEDKVLEYNRYIAEAGKTLIVPNGNFNLRQLFENA